MLQYQIIPVTPFQQNCTLLWDDQTHEAVLIDAGGDVERLNQAVQARGLKLVALWLTHGHLDHVGGVGRLAREHGVPVIGPHRADQFWLDGIQMQAQMFRFAPPEPVRVTQWLDQGDTLQLGEHTFEVRHAPGHTPGSVLIHSEKLGLLWTGDVLFVGSIGRTDFPQGNLEQLLASIRREVFSLPEDTRFISGHGPMGTVGEEIRSYPFVSGRFG